MDYQMTPHHENFYLSKMFFKKYGKGRGGKSIFKGGNALTVKLGA